MDPRDRCLAARLDGLLVKSWIRGAGPQQSESVAFAWANAAVRKWQRMYANNVRGTVIVFHGCFFLYFTL